MGVGDGGGGGGGGGEREGKVPAMRLPRGYRFDPKSWELIEYLQDKVEGRPNAGQRVINDGIDVYGYSPKQLVDMVGDLIMGDDGSSFFFTSIKYRSRNCRDRSTPDGRWKSTKKMTGIRNGEGRLVGHRQDLCYFHGKEKPERTRWLMKEHILDQQQPKIALCEIYSAQNKCKGRIQGNEWSFQPLKLQESIDSESEDTQLYYPSNDSSFWGMATEAGEPKLSKTEETVGPNERGGLCSSKEEEGFLSAPATTARCLSGGDVHTGFKNVIDFNPCIGCFCPSQQPPIVHADAAFEGGGSAEVAGYPDMLPNTNALDMLQDSLIFGCGEMDGSFRNSHDSL